MFPTPNNLTTYYQRNLLKLFIGYQQSHSFSPVDITEKRGEPRKNSKKAEFGIIRKQIFHRITYPKSSKIHLGENFL